MRTLILGFGYLGRRVAALARQRGDTVFATTRSADKFAAIEQIGGSPIEFDWNDARHFRRLPEVDRMLVAISYDRGSNVDRESSMVGGLGRLLDHVSPQTSLCYISTTGVYHQTGGVWVDESSPTRPSRDGGQAHLRAEALLRARRTAKTDSKTAGGYAILRLSGIYGPGRIPRANDIRDGRPIASPAEGYLNLIHVDDAALVVDRAWDDCERFQAGGSPGYGQTFVVSDDEPVVRRHFYEEIARHYRVPPPRFVDPALDAPVRFRSESNKRIWNRRMKRQLVARLQFPDFRAGLKDALRGT